MSRVARRTTKVAAVIVAAVALAGCAGLHPGVAAKVGDETITIREVDDFAHGLCVYLPNTPNGPSTHANARSLAVGILVRSALANQYGDRTSFQLDQSQIEASLKSVESGVKDLSDDEREQFLDAVRESLEGEQFASLAARSALLAQGKNVDDQTVQAEVTRLYTEWSADEGVELDPRFGTWNKVDSKPGSGSLSVLAGSDTEPGSTLPGAQTCS